MLLSTTELSAATGVPCSTINLLVKQGVLRPALPAQGSGSRHEFDTDNVAQLKAIATVKSLFGTGTFAARVLEHVRDVRTDTSTLRIPEFQVSL